MTDGVSSNTWHTTLASLSPRLTPAGGPCDARESKPLSAVSKALGLPLSRGKRGKGLGGVCAVFKKVVRHLGTPHSSSQGALAFRFLCATGWGSRYALQHASWALCGDVNRLRCL